MKHIFLLFFVLLGLPVFSAVNLGKIEGVSAVSDQEIHQAVDGKKGLVVVFLSTQCPCSDSHVVELKNLASDYTEFNFIAVNSNMDETKKMAQEYFKRAHLNFPVIKDKNAEIADRYKAFKTPHAFVIDGSGQIVYQGGVSSSRQLATADRKYLREALANIQKGQPVTLPESRTLGCVISRGEKNVW